MTEGISPTLDPSQLHVAEAPPESRLIVTAAAGQGKTEVVLARLESLAQDGVDVQSNVLVLSFSRAAVDAVRRRLRRTGRASVTVRTFDSFAAKVILDVGELDGVRGFEGRIRKATELIAAGEADVDHIEHLVLDESQDLVGDRAEMVLALLEKLPDVGFTVLGDPLQGIYDFQLDKDVSVSKRTSHEFLDVLEFGLGAERVELTGHYRALSARTSSLLPVGDELRALPQADETRAPEGHRVLDMYRLGRGEGGGKKDSLLRLRGYLDDEGEETSAVLAATNYTVLLASEQLDEMGIRHVVRRSAQDVGVAPWVTLALANLPRRKHAQRTIMEALAATPDAPEDGWRRLKDAEGLHRDPTLLDMPLLARRLRAGIIPFDLMPEDFSPVVVSTVHRAKGLEFDHVLELIPGDAAPAGKPTWQNLRRKYVAASRARKSFFVVPEPAVPGRGLSGDGTRCVERPFRRTRPVRFEVLNDDVVTDIPVLIADEAAALDRLTRNGELLGTTVELVLERQPTAGTLPNYWIMTHEGARLGGMAERFVSVIGTRMKFRDAPWPVRLHGARITSVESAVADDAIRTKTEGLGEGGCWLVPRLTGLVCGQWDDDKEKIDD